MGDEQLQATPYGPEPTGPVEPERTWLRQWLVQTVAAVPLMLLTLLVLADGSQQGDAAAVLLVSAGPFLLWAALLCGLAALLRGASPGQRAGWSAAAGTVLSLVSVLGVGSLLPYAAALLAACQVGLAAVLVRPSRARRIGLAAGGALAAVAGAAAARLVLATIGADTAGSERAANGIVGGLVLAGLVAAIVLALLAGRRGWASLAAVGLVAAALCVAVTAPVPAPAPEPAPHRIPAGPDGVDCETDPAPCGG